MIETGLEDLRRRRVARDMAAEARKASIRIWTDEPLLDPLAIPAWEAVSRAFRDRIKRLHLRRVGWDAVLDTIAKRFTEIASSPGARRREPSNQ
jgi:hypothetical protein